MSSSTSCGAGRWSRSSCASPSPLVNPITSWPFMVSRVRSSFRLSAWSSTMTIVATVPPSARWGGEVDDYGHRVEGDRGHACPRGLDRQRTLRAFSVVLVLPPLALPPHGGGHPLNRLPGVERGERQGDPARLDLRQVEQLAD